MHIPQPIVINPPTPEQVPIVIDTQPIPAPIPIQPASAVIANPTPMANLIQIDQA